MKEDLIIKNNDIIVTESIYKLDILNKLNIKKELINVKFITKKEFLSKYYFSYDEKAVYYLMNKYNINESIAKVYLDNLYYIDNKKYNNQKLDNLVKIKQELIKENLLVFDDLFKDYIKSKRVVFYNYNSFTKFELNLIENLKEICDVIAIDKQYKKYDHKVYEFDNIFDEVSFIATEILKLIDKGIEPNKIKITNIDDDYKYVIDYIFPLYGIKTDINENYLISNAIVKEFLSMNDSIENRINYLNEKYKNSEILNPIVKIVNKYIIFKNNNIVNEMITNEFKTKKIEKEKYNNLIEVIDYKNYPINEEYVFLLGFNQGSIPKQYKDEDYITDDLKQGLLLDTTIEKNKIEKEIAINNILNIKNLIITYKNSTPFNTYYPSNLIQDLNLQVVQYKDSEIYSKDYSSLVLGNLLDKYVLYGSVPDDLKSYNSSLSIPYNTYDNSFKGIDKNKYLDSIKDGFNLSYSSMNDYYNCAFKYYLSNVLKLNIYEDNFAAYIGSLFHYVLEKGLLSNIEVLSLIKDFQKENKRNLSYKEEFFIKNITPDIEFALDTIKDNLNKTDLKNILFEKRVEVTKQGKVTVTFKGFIDKIMYEEENDKTIVAIVDYKTGNSDIDLKYVPFGLSMQLPVYLYLASNIKEIKNPVFGGFYLQKVLCPKPTIEINKDIETKKKEGILLYGYSNSDKDITKKVDNTYVNSTMIKSLKLKKDGEFYSNSKVLNNDEINNLIKTTDNKIEESIDLITNASFDINPKAVDNKNIGCKYCDYKDICFMTKKDEINITPDDNLSFLGGDYNA